ncbi:MAG: PKD domain-containing protein [Planctomycetaceae bacterium]
MTVRVRCKSPLNTAMWSLFVIGLASQVLTQSLQGADNWHAGGWNARAVVEISELSSEADSDTAAVQIFCMNRAQPDGKDFRVYDAEGQPVPFQVMSLQAGRSAWIAFRAASPAIGKTYFVYFDNTQATAAAEQVVADDRPGAGIPQGAWTPKSGLIYITRARPEGENPETVDDLEKMLAASPRVHGARYQRRVSDGFNPFGSSDNYLSIYRGWIRIPADGTYHFCTASNEASFSFLDGQELVHWPGRHTEERGLHGEKNRAIDLTAGLHYLEYYHEEVTLAQMAFLGWSPPGSREGEYAAIPEELFTMPHHCRVLRYESPQGPLLTLQPAIVSSIWPTERHTGQYTKARFVASMGTANAIPTDTTINWNFGDGQSGTGVDIEHVYLALGSYEVTATVELPTGNVSATWPLDVYEIQHVTGEIGEGQLADYALVASMYDQQALSAVSLKELVHLLYESEQYAAAVNAGSVFLARFSATDPAMLPEVHRQIAFSELQQGDDRVEAAIAAFQSSLESETDLAHQFDALAQLIRLLGIDRRNPAQAQDFIAQVESLAKSRKLDVEGLAAYRRAVIAAGDVSLWQGELPAALKWYKRAEAVDGKSIPVQVRSAKLGAYPDYIRDYIALENYATALEVVNEWEETFPTEKIHGHSLYWRGKSQHLRGQHRHAAENLARAIGLAPGAVFETEARWLLAGSLDKLGRPKDAQQELGKLTKLGFADPFVTAARKKLQESLPKK